MSVVTLETLNINNNRFIENVVIYVPKIILLCSCFLHFVTRLLVRNSKILPSINYYDKLKVFLPVTTIATPSQSMNFHRCANSPNYSIP